MLNYNNNRVLKIYSMFLPHLEQRAHEDFLVKSNADTTPRLLEETKSLSALP